jgi:hypothetical protein
MATREYSKPVSLEITVILSASRLIYRMSPFIEKESSFNTALPLALITPNIYK